MSSRAAIFPQISRAWAYFALTKPDVTFLVVITTLAGYYLGSRGAMNHVLLAHSGIGTALIGAGDCPLSPFRELTKSKWAEMPFRYAVRAVALSPERYAASALTNCSCAYVTKGIFVLSSNT